MNSTLSYVEKLKDPRWQKTRLQVFERDLWGCVICHTVEDTLNVHHLNYEYGKEPWEYELEDLATLCEDCHKNEKLVSKDTEKELIKAIRRKFISSANLNQMADAIERMSLPHVPDVFMDALASFFFNDKKLYEFIKDFLNSPKQPKE